MIKIRCIDNAWYENELIIGKIYNAIQDYSWEENWFVDLAGVPVSLKKTRFEVVEE